MRTPEATDAPDSLPQHRKKREGIEGGSYTMGYTHSHAAISPRYYYRLSKEMVTFSRCLTGCYLAVLSRTFPNQIMFTRLKG
jgi:hypothetical protein